MTMLSIGLDDVLYFFNGKKSIPSKTGKFDIYGSNGVIGQSEQFNQPSSIILGRVGTCGAVQYSAKPFWASDNTIIVRPKKGQNQKYWYYKLKTLSLREFAGGSAQPLITQTTLKSIKTKIHHEKLKQDTIAKTLSSYDDLIENNRRRIALLEKSAHLLYREWFVHFRFSKYPSHNCKLPLPDGWSWGRMDDIGDIITGKTPPKKKADFFGGNIPFIKTPDMHGNTFVIETEETLTESGANYQVNKNVPPLTSLISCIGTLGVVSLVNELSQFNQQINAVVPKDKHWAIYNWCCLCNLEKKLKSFGDGATMANVNKSKFSSIEVLLPPQKIIEEFAKITKPFLDQIRILQISNTKLTKARNLLLPRLMDGRIKL